MWLFCKCKNYFYIPGGSLDGHINVLNYHNESSRKYKIAIIKNLIHRAFYISSETIFYKKLTNVKQTLGNNNFPNKLVDQQIKLYLYNIHKYLKQ